MHVFKGRCAINVYSVAVLHCCLISACHWVSDTSRRVLTAVGSTEGCDGRGQREQLSGSVARSRDRPPSAASTPRGRRSPPFWRLCPCGGHSYQSFQYTIHAFSFHPFLFWFYCAPIVKNCGFVPARQALMSRCYANHDQQMDFPSKDDGHF